MEIFFLLPSANDSEFQQENVWWRPREYLPASLHPRQATDNAHALLHPPPETVFGNSDWTLGSALSVSAGVPLASQEIIPRSLSLPPQQTQGQTHWRCRVSRLGNQNHGETVPHFAGTQGRPRIGSEVVTRNRRERRQLPVDSQPLSLREQGAAFSQACTG